MRITKTERQLVTQYCIRWPSNGAEWLEWATSEEAKRMLANEVGRRYAVAEALLRKVVLEFSAERLKRVL